MSSIRVAVLGAGLLGVCTALELARRGARVLLIEQDELALNRASLRNEGKIHLGFVYARSTFETARWMMRGALSFRRLVDGWTAGALESLRVSTPFRYVVVDDSQLAPAEIEAHYVAVQELYDQSDGDYLSRRPDRLWRKLSDSEHARGVLRRVQAAYSTEEVAIDLEHLAGALRQAVRAEPKVEACFGVRVEGVERRPNGFRVLGMRDGESWSGSCEQVVNALWDGRLAIDAPLCGLPGRPWVYRLKHRVLADLPEPMRGLPSMTFVLGPYGDMVTRPNAPGYISWYPECMRGWSEAVAPPDAWASACRGELSAEAQLALGCSALREFDRLIPGLAGARVRSVDAGVIFAWGDRDITEPGSELHRRDEIGVESCDGYHTVNTGKLTTAPLFAMETANRVLRPNT